MRHWTVGRRIASGYAVLLVLLVVTSAVGIFALADTRATFRTAIHTKTDRELKGIASLQGTDATVVSFLSFLIRGNPEALDSLEERFATTRRLVSELRDESTTVAQTTGWSDALRLLDDWNAAIQDAIAARRAGRIARARSIYEEQVLPIRQEERGVVEGLVRSESAHADELADSASSTATESTWLLVAVAILTIAAGILIAVRVPRTINARLRGAISTLSSASAEIVAATTQQASGAAEEQSAVHQTTATVDEVRQTVQLSTDKAAAVARSVQETADVSRDGREAVEDSVRGTQEAKASMERLAQRILALSEQAQAIGEIVTTVKGLSDQSNMLAVNAGIEAAKAGETGKGFAVVAVEVKGLADQSRRATEEIRELLNEVQRATHSAVLAAEQGVKASEAGEEVANRAGEAITRLSERITESADAAHQILVSSQQQLTGMDQLSLAMESIQDGATQTLASTRQVETAAHDLNDLARGLEQLVTGSTNGLLAEPAKA